MDENATTEDLAYYLAEIRVLLDTYLIHKDAMFSDGTCTIDRNEVALQHQYLINEFRIH